MVVRVDMDLTALRVLLVADQLTLSSLRYGADVVEAWPWSLCLPQLRRKPDFLLVESAWSAASGLWKYKIAAYPGYPGRSNNALRKLLERAKRKGIPTVFWNKEDGVHFERFIDSARLFDHVFTVDENCLPRYKAVMGQDASVHVLKFAIQPRTHGFQGFAFKHNRANFVGSYSHHVHDQRRLWQDMFFGAATESGLGLTVVDRNSARKAAHYRYPALSGLEVLPAVSHADTARIYRDYLVSLNVNTIEDSPTMFSRRLVEILGCGGIAVTNPSPAVDAMFRDYCHVVNDAEGARELFARLRHGPSHDDLERARAGADYVLQHHTWAHRLEQIRGVVGL